MIKMTKEVAAIVDDGQSEVRFSGNDVREFVAQHHPLLVSGSVDDSLTNLSFFLMFVADAFEEKLKDGDEIVHKGYALAVRVAESAALEVSQMHIDEKRAELLAGPPDAAKGVGVPLAEPLK